MTLSFHFEAIIGQLNLSATLEATHDMVVVIGPNGAGKSSLLKAVLGTISIGQGHFSLGGELIYSSREGVHTPTQERRLGYVPQRFGLFPHMTVFDNVAFGLREERKLQRTRVFTLLDDLGIAHLAKRKAGRLSGGESQRVALARALAISPRALLLDEPMSALDPGAKRKVRHFLASRLKAIGIPSLVVSHDLDDVVAFGGQVAVLENGRITQSGTASELRANPKTPFVNDFFEGARPERTPDSGLHEVKSWNQ